MILGSIVEVEGLSKIDNKRLDGIVKATLDEIRTNPIIDEQIRTNHVIVKALSAVVSNAVKGEKLDQGFRPDET